MSRQVPFVKMAGTGNDFLVIDARRTGKAGLRLPWKRVAQRVCDRRDGIGADGLLVLERARGSDARMRIFNADGSEAEMCGNGARCVASFLRQSAANGRSSAGPVTVETRAGRLSARVIGHRVAIRMTDPTDLRLDLSVPVHGRRTLPVGTLLSILKDANISVEQFNELV